jgi:transposase InsO family protein
MELSTRRVDIAGITPHPTAAFMQQCARQLTDHFDGFLHGKRYLIHDRDTTFTAAFDQYLRDHGVEPVILPPQSPNLNAHCERFVRSIKEEALDRMICMGEASLRYAIRWYLSYWTLAFFASLRWVIQKALQNWHIISQSRRLLAGRLQQGACMLIAMLTHHICERTHALLGGGMVQTPL